jgi:RNA polymerase sigma-70 factor (ECF subfamily)
MQLNQFDDQQLVVEYIKGNESAFEILLERHRDKVFNYIVYMLKDIQLSEDVFQETFFKAIYTLKSGRYNEEGKFLPWIMRIAHNLIVDQFRRIKKMPALEPRDEEHDIFSTLRILDDNVQDQLIESEIHTDLKKIINHLPEDQREVVLMRHFADMSFKEIADATNVSINTALGRMRYALLNLRKMIEKNNITLSA